MLTSMAVFSVGVAIGLGAWWLSRDRRRGKAVRLLASTNHLQVEVLYDACMQALRSGRLEDFTFLVRQVHPQPERKPIDIQRRQWNRKPPSDALEAV